MNVIKSVTASELARGKNYKVSKHLVPVNCQTESNTDDYFHFSVDGAVPTEENQVMIVTMECKTIYLGASQHVIEMA